MPNLEDLNAQLISASNRGDSEAVKALISKTNPTFNGSGALRVAAQQGHAECVSLLIPVSDPTAADSHALQTAAFNGHIECVRLLIPVSHPKSENSRALRWAAAKGHADCVAILLPVSDPFALGDDGLNASDLARARGHTDIAGMIDAFIEATALSTSILAHHAKPASRTSL